MFANSRSHALAVAQRARLVAAGSHGRVRCRLLRPGLHGGRETSRELRKHEVEVASRQSLLAYSGKMFAPGGTKRSPAERSDDETFLG